MGQKLVSPATYWRRRVVVFTGGMAVLTLLTWGVNAAVSGAFAGSPAAGHGSPGSHADGPATRARGERGSRHALANQTADLRSRQRAKPQPSTPSPSASTAPSPGSGQQADAHTAPVPGAGQQACASGAVVLTLHSPRSRYGPGSPATFVVGAVSTRSRPCQVNLGPRFVSVVIDSGGTPIWDSSSCARGTISHVITLKRGVPALLQVTWDRRISQSGCPGQGGAVRPGSYTAGAFYGQLRSHPTTFVLSGRGAAAP